MLSEAEQSQPKEPSGTTALEQKVAAMLSEAETPAEDGSPEPPEDGSKESQDGETKPE